MANNLDSLLECDGASLQVGFYHPSDSFRRMSEHICVMDVSRGGGEGGELIALFGPSRCAGATAEEEAKSEAQARLFIASVRMLAALQGVMSVDRQTDEFDAARAKATGSEAADADIASGTVVIQEAA